MTRQQIIDGGYFTGEEILKLKACEDEPKALWNCMMQILKDRD